VRDHYGHMRLDAIDEDVLRAFATSILREEKHPKGPVRFLMTLLREAEKARIIKKAPSIPRGLLKESKKLPDAPIPGEASGASCEKSRMPRSTARGARSPTSAASARSCA
jgi:hypothetical protein